MQKSILLKTSSVIIAIFCFLNELSAGWFICHIYKGQIGKDSVIISMQIQRKYSTTTGDYLSVYGVFLNNTYQTPIPISGKFNIKNHEIILSQKNDIADSAYWHLKIIGESLIGSYIVGQGKSEHIILKEVANLIDTPYHSKIETIGVSILQDTSLNKYLLRGIYSIRQYQDARMDRLELVDKETNKIFQVIDLSVIDFPAGNLVTNIFKNVEIQKNINSADYGNLIIWCRAGKRGGYVTATYDSMLGMYKLNPEAQKYYPTNKDE